MAIEEGGVPTVAVHTDVFARLARSVARVNGMPTTRQAFVPQPVVGRSPAELRSYIEGVDPVNERPFMQEVIEGLTRPLDEADTTGLSFDRSTERLLEPDAEENLHRLFLESNWTDFLPIVLPTEERVEAMLAGTSHSPDEVVGRLRPTAYREFWEFTVEKVAVNAVMAGARPEYLPVVLAMAASGLTGRQSSTTSFATISVVNGPIRNEIAMNPGIGAMGPYNHANATVGRAYSLLSQNLQGGSVPGESYMGSIGNVYAYTAAYPENEEQSPWEPLHVEHGFEPEASTVSLFNGGWWTLFGNGPRDSWEDQFRRAVTAVDPFTSPNTGVAPLVVLDPLSARAFVERGFDEKQKLAAWLAEHSLLPAREYWDNMWMQSILRPLAVAGVEPWASHLRAAPEELVQMFQPADISVVVIGGGTQPVWKMIGGSLRGRIVSVDDWR
ncbi:MAG TPA: UGSC family (seleno)protein [Gaiella sp.]